VPRDTVRQILTPKVGSDGLFVQPRDGSAQREVIERHNRERFAEHFKYADPWAGNPRTYDADGDYLCGECNQADGTKCLLVKIKRISREAGSCAHWEDLCAGDPEIPLHQLTPETASYGVSKSGEGFGCKRCPYASKAYYLDSRGRSLYCGKGDFRVLPTACCALNGAPVING